MRAATPKSGGRALLVASVLATLMAVGTPAAEARDPVRVTQAVPATRADLNPSRMYGSPVIAVHPENQRTLVAAGAEIRSRTCGLLVSTDAGETWGRPEASPMAERFPFCFQTETGPRQADVAFGRNGTLYYTYAGWDVEDTASDWPIGVGGGWRGNVSVVLSRSDDLGGSWETILVRNARGLQGNLQENNRPVSSIAVDTRNGSDDIVYIGWKVTYRDRQGLLIAVSRDGGRSFSDPVDLTAGYFDDDANRRRLAQGASLTDTPPPNRIMYYWPDLTLDDDGALYAIWNARFGPGPQMDDTGAFLSRSDDGGRTFTVTEVSPAPDTYRYPMIQWTDQAGAEGTLHLVYEGATPQNIDWLFDVYHVRSTDQGQTWSTPTRLSDDPPEDLAGKYHPDLAISPDGRIDVAWWDFRHDNGNFANDVYLASSTDNGLTWGPNVRVTDRSINRRIGVWYGNADIRQAPGIAATGKYTVLGWDDTRNGDDTTHTQDVYTSMVQYEALGSGTSSALRYAVGAAAGVAVVGLALLLLAAVQRRRLVGLEFPERSGQSQPA